MRRAGGTAAPGPEQARSPRSPGRAVVTVPARRASRTARVTAPGPHYSAPRLYEIAFDLNRKGEVDFLEGCFKRFARRRVRRVLDIACGTGPHLLRLAARGYRMSGLDLSPANIAFLARRARGAGFEPDLLVQDSQGHLLTNERLVAHLRAVARALRPGGLYVFDRYMTSSWTDPARRWSWSRRRGRLIVRASFSALNDVDPVSQVFRERMELEAIENGTRRLYRQSHLSRMVFPQELKSLVALAGGFEFVQWFFGFKPHQVLERSRHPLLMVVVLRKKQ